MKLQLGTSRFARLSPAARAYFRKPGWIHLGDAEPNAPLVERARDSVRDYGFLNAVKIAGRILTRRVTAPSSADECQVARPEVIPFFYQKGDVLPYEDGTFGFVFSEHFFEHLFLDEA